MSILGISALGDALGAAYEFEQTLPVGETPRLHPYGGRFSDHSAGEWTDDTSMAICIALAAAREDLRTEAGLDELSRLYVKWAREYPAGIGGQTRRVLDLDLSSTSAAVLRERAVEHLRKDPGRSAGNGSLMRVHPVALLQVSREDAALIARSVTELTHADPLCLDASVLWVEMLRAAKQTSNLRPQAGLDLVPLERRAFWVETIFDALSESSGVFSVEPWWVVPAFQQALSAVHKNLRVIDSDPMRVFTEIISAEDSDSDTICAIAGGLMGALGVTTDMFSQELVSQVHGKWPEVYSIETLRDLESFLS